MYTRATSGGELGGVPFSKLKKSTLILGKNCLDYIHVWVKKNCYIKIDLDFFLKVMNHLSAEKLVKSSIPYLI